MTNLLRRFSLSAKTPTQTSIDAHLGDSPSVNQETIDDSQPTPRRSTSEHYELQPSSPRDNKDYSSSLHHVTSIDSQPTPRKSTNVNGDAVDKGPPKWRSQRYILAVFFMTGMMNIFAQRTSFSLALVCMLNHTAVAIDAGVGLSGNTSAMDMIHETWPATSGAEIHLVDGTFNWNQNIQDTLLGAPYYTIMVVQIPIGFLVANLKKKKLLLCATTITSSLTIMSPLFTVEWWLLFIVRMIQGICVPLSLFSMFTMWNHWAPPDERATLISIQFAGQFAGNALVLPLAAGFCTTFGWSYVFYLPGVVGILWCILYFIFTSENPEQNRFITKEETHYIRQSLPPRTAGDAKPKPAPYCKILKSRAFLGLTFLFWSFSFTFFLMIGKVNFYFREVLELPLGVNGSASALPFIILMIVIPGAGILSDIIISRKWLSKTRTRKLFVIVGNMAAAGLMVLLGYLDCHHAAGAVIVLSLAMGISGFTMSVASVNGYDLSPKFATVILSLANTAATFNGLYINNIAGALTANKAQAQAGWKNVFLLSTGVLVLGCLVFEVMGSGDLQAFDNVDLHVDDDYSDDITKKRKRSKIQIAL